MGSNYEHLSAVRRWQGSSNNHNGRAHLLHLCLSLPKWSDLALQTSSTPTASETNEAILTAKPPARVCPLPLTNAHQLLLSRQLSNTTGLHGKVSITLGPTCFCSYQHHDRDEKHHCRSACALPLFNMWVADPPGSLEMAQQRLVGILMYGHKQGSKTLQALCCLLTMLQTRIKLV